jgi:hypothetical protein
MIYIAYCPECEKKVTAITLLGGDALWQSLDSGAEVEVMHTSESGDHRWKLNKYEKENLRKEKAKGSI